MFKRLIMGGSPWTKEEIQIFEDNIGFLPPEKIVAVLKKKGFHRTRGSVRSRARYLGISYKCEYDNLYLREIARILNISGATTSDWYRTGKLTGEKIERNGYVMVAHQEVKRFLSENKLKCNLDPDGLNFFLNS
jgi:hypothetical protein